LPGCIKLRKSHWEWETAYPNLSPWEGDRLLAEVAGRFLDHFVRQNTAELPEIRLEEHIELVQHTADERAIYLSQAHDVLLDSAELIKLCSHFQADGEHVQSATVECQRIRRHKERRALKAEHQLHRCAIVMAILERKYRETVCTDACDEWRRELVEAETHLRRGGDASKRSADALTLVTQEALQVAALQPTAWPGKLGGHDPQFLKVLQPATQQSRAGQWQNFFELRLQAPELHKLLVSQAREQAANLQELHVAKGSLEFFCRTVTTLADDSSPEVRSCSVCLEEGLLLTRLVLTPCAHTFCFDCLRDTIEKCGFCSICRQPLSSKDIQPLEAELAPNLQQGMPEGDKVFSKYGTKLATVVQKLQELRASDPQAKVILFVQFEDLKRKVVNALDEFGIPAVHLRGSVVQRSGVVRDWQHNPDSTSFVMVLSLTDSACGTNLTAANHVILLHPMLADTAERAVSFELQAIGRAWRHGQRRDVVHVWRYVTAGTVEQAITEQHAAALAAQNRLCKDSVPS